MEWSLKHFILSGVLAALIFALAFLLGAGIISATGIPATGGIANIFVAVFVLIIGMKVVPKFGFSTLTVGIVFTLAVPTIIGGPPGVYKPVNGILIGLVADITIYIGRYNRWSYILGGSLAAVTSIVSIYVAMVVLKLPGIEGLRPLLLPLSVMQAVLGALAAWGAVLVFERRLVQLNSVERLRASPRREENKSSS